MNQLLIASTNFWLHQPTSDWINQLPIGLTSFWVDQRTSDWQLTLIGVTNFWLDQSTSDQINFWLDWPTSDWIWINQLLMFQPTFDLDQETSDWINQLLIGSTKFWLDQPTSDWINKLLITSTIFCLAQQTSNQLLIWISKLLIGLTNFWSDQPTSDWINQLLIGQAPSDRVNHLLISTNFRLDQLWWSVDTLLCWCVFVLMCWWLCWCVCWCVDVLMWCWGWCDWSAPARTVGLYYYFFTEYRRCCTVRPPWSYSLSIPQQIDRCKYSSVFFLDLSQTKETRTRSQKRLSVLQDALVDLLIWQSFFLLSLKFRVFLGLW
jgi:hypothetical protein